MKSVIKMSSSEAKRFFLKKGSYFNLEKFIDNVMNVIGNETDFKKLNVKIQDIMNQLTIK